LPTSQAYVNIFRNGFGFELIIAPFSLILLVLGEYIYPTKELYSDLGEHLLRGQILFQTGQIPTKNIFSYTYPDFHFVNLEWLSEAVLYLVNLFSGINGLIIFTVIITLFSLTLLYYFAIKRGNILLVSYSMLIYLLVLYERANVRPEVFSYLLLSVFVILLYKFREKYTRLIWLIIPLQLIWVNMHIYFILGILLVGLFLFEALINFRKRDEGRYIKTLVIIFVSSCFISLINPYGLSGLLFPFTFAQNYAFPVDENMNLFQYESAHQWSFFVSVFAFGILSTILSLSLILQHKKARLIDVLISIVFITISVLALRNIALFVFATFIPFTFIVNSLIEKYSQQLIKKFKGFVPKLNLLLTLIFPIAAITLSWGIIVQNGEFGLGVAQGNDKAVDFFVKNKLKGPIFNNYDIGSYLAYRLYPKEKVFVDTRPEAYPASFFQQVYFPIQKNLVDFKAADNKYNFNSIVYRLYNGMPQSVGFIRYLTTSKDWKIVYLDSMTVIFVKNVKLNQNIIEKYAMSDNNFRFPDYQNPDSLYGLAHFLDLMAWKRSEIEAFQKINVLDPSNCTVLYDLIILIGPHSTSATSYQNSYYINKCRM
jgi:hypothetical protein